MAKPAKNKKPNARTDKQALLRDGPNWPLFILALIGMGLTAYLTYTAGKAGWWPAVRWAAPATLS